MKALKIWIWLWSACFLIQPTYAQNAIRQTFSVNAPIPDAGEYLDVQSWSLEPVTIGELEVTLNFAGRSGPGFNGDLYVTLSNDSGAFAVLLNRPGKKSTLGAGYSDSGMTVTLSDHASHGDIHLYRQELSGDSTPLPGSLAGDWQPDGRATDPDNVLPSDPRTKMLASFAGTSSSGRWYLFVADMSGGALHTLESWGLTIRQTGSGQEDKRAAAFVGALEADGFTVQKGTVVVTDLAYAVNNHFIDSAAGYNAGQFYKRFVVPLAAGQTGIPPFLFRLAADEAVVYVGKTPPACDYFSFCAFLWSRRYPDSYLPSGDWLFASVGDPLNNSWINTEGGGNPFQKDTIVILTADRGAYERIRNAAGLARFPASIVNPLVLPSSILRLGQDPASDSFLVLVRTANIASESQEREYLGDDQWAKLYRVTPRVAPQPQPFEQPPWRERKAIDEETLVPGLTAGLQRLKAAILAQTAHVEASPLDSVQGVYNSKDVLDPSSPAYRKNAMGESSDTPYRRSAENGEPVNFLLGNEDMVVVYGVNHAATGIATYSSFAVYGEWQLNHLPLEPGDPQFMFGAGDPFWNGVVGVTNDEFAGSAKQYLPRDPMARYLYAVRVVRKARADLRDPYCVVVPESGDSEAAPFYPDVIPLDKPAMIGYRAYLNPSTKAGPAYEDLIPDRAIWFKVK